MVGRRPESVGLRAAEPSPSRPVTAPGAGGLEALAATVGNRALASAIAARPSACGLILRVPAAVARQPSSGQAEIPAPLRSLAEGRIAPELGAVAEELRKDSPPTLERMRRLRVRVQAVRDLFDTVKPPAGRIGENWSQARSETAIARTLIDGLLNPGSDALLRLSWGKALGTCRQLVGMLFEAEPAPSPDVSPAPSPNPLPPPPPPPPGAQPAVPAATLPPSQVMEFEVCPTIEAAIAEIPAMVASESTEDIVKTRDRFDNVPERIVATAGDLEFGEVAAVEFEKGLELVTQATLAPPEQLAQIAEMLNHAAAIAEDLTAETIPDPDVSESEPPPSPSFVPAPSPNPLPPPPPPPIK